MPVRHRLVGALPGILACVTLVLLLGPPVSGSDEKTRPAATAKSAEKRLTIQMQAMPWKKVFDWLAEQTGLPIIADTVPTGTFTFIPPAAGKGPRTYTTSEVIDLLNEALLTSRHVLIRRPTSLRLVAVDERLDPALTPLIGVDDLARRGKTEVVRTILSLNSANPKEALAVVKSLLGPLGEVVSIGNRLLVRDTVENLRQIVRLLQEVDKASARPERPALTGLPILKSYSVPSGHAESLAKTLQEAYRKTPDVKITAVGTHLLLVYAEPNDQVTIARHILDAAPPLTIEVVMLNTLDAPRTVEQLRTLFAGGRGSGPIIEADTRRNAVLIRGSSEQVEEVKSALRTLGEVGTPTGGVRIITLERGDAATLAEALKDLIPKIQPNPVRVIVPGGKPQPGAKPPAPAKGGAEAKKPAGKGTAPVTITPAGNKLIVACEDPKVLALAQDLVRLLTAPQEGGLEVIRLRHGSAVDAAKILDEVFNERPAVGTSGRRSERVRIVAEPSTNALIIRASPLDMLVIRRLLTMTLDVPREDSEAMLRTFIISLRHAQAAEIAKVVQGLYRDNAKTTLTVGVDPRSNSLILRCSAALYEDVRKLVENLDVKVEKK